MSAIEFVSKWVFSEIMITKFSIKMTKLGQISLIKIMKKDTILATSQNQTQCRLITASGARFRRSKIKMNGDIGLRYRISEISSFQLKFITNHSKFWTKRIRQFWGNFQLCNLKNWEMTFPTNKPELMNNNPWENHKHQASIQHNISNILITTDKMKAY